MRKSELMRSLFGAGEGTCKDCKHFSPASGGWSKCKIYGKSASEAIDWNRKYPACGLKNLDINLPDIPVVKMVRSTIQVTDTEGQINLWEGGWISEDESDEKEKACRTD